MPDNIKPSRPQSGAEAADCVIADARPMLVCLAGQRQPKSVQLFGDRPSPALAGFAADIGAQVQAQSGADLVLVAGALEQASASDIDALLTTLRAAQGDVAFLISTRLSATILSDGANLHRTVKIADWWHERLQAYFPDAFLAPSLDASSALLTSWRPGEDAIAAAKELARRRARRSSFPRRLNRLENDLRLWTRPPLSQASLLAQLDGKTVAIVGNAYSLSEKSFGAEIDSHDVVIRFNGAGIPDVRSHGRRADWMATGIPFTPEMARAYGVKAVLWMSPNRKNLPPWMSRRAIADFYVHRPQESDRLAAELGVSRPSSGAMIIDLVLRNQRVKAVSLYGFDFFATLSYSGGHTAATAPHDFAKERRFVEALAARDQRLSLAALNAPG